MKSIYMFIALKIARKENKVRCKSTKEKNFVFLHLTLNIIIMMVNGSEAIALAVKDCNVKYAFGYPGTPSSEIIKFIESYDDIYCEWSVNEKVALEEAYGVSLSNYRSIVTMKHVGLNVALDSFNCIAYTGVKKGLVLVVADDPEIESSQNRQNTRMLCEFAHIPLLEPSNVNECYFYTKVAFTLSEQYKTVIVLRITSYIANLYETLNKNVNCIANNHTYNFPTSFVLLPHNAKINYNYLIERENIISHDLNIFNLNEFSGNNEDTCIVTAGDIHSRSIHYCKEFSVYKIAMLYPFQKDLVFNLLKSFNNIYVLEDLEPFLGNKIKLLFPEKNIKSISDFNKGIYSQEDINNFIHDRNLRSIEKCNNLKDKPTFCSGCSYAIIFTILSKYNITVIGDIGCYTLGANFPYDSVKIAVSMGSSIGISTGINLSKNEVNVCVIGDSTFFHSGLSPLINMVYNKHKGIIIILNNETTAMTGFQENPSTYKENKNRISISHICKSLGIENVIELTPNQFQDIPRLIQKAKSRNDISIIILDCICITKILREKKYEK